MAILDPCEPDMWWSGCCDRGTKSCKKDHSATEHVFVAIPNSKGTYNCPICGVGSPHSHSEDDIKLWLIAQASRFVPDKKVQIEFIDKEPAGKA